jgi:sec-independent protein translocase protein TatB
MFDLGFAEMLVIGIVALLVIGPERLPSVAKTVGTYVGRIRRFVNNVRSDVEREFRTDELQRMLQQQQDELQSLKDTINENREQSDLGSIRDDVESTMADFKKQFVEEPESSVDTSVEKPPKPDAGP